jgi:hypothetical protein
MEDEDILNLTLKIPVVPGKKLHNGYTTPF